MLGAVIGAERVTVREWTITLAFWCVLMVGYGMILFGWFMGPGT